MKNTPANCVLEGLSIYRSVHELSVLCWNISQSTSITLISHIQCSLQLTPRMKWKPIVRYAIIPCTENTFHWSMQVYTLLTVNLFFCLLHICFRASSPSERKKREEMTCNYYWIPANNAQATESLSLMLSWTSLDVSQTKSKISSHLQILLRESPFMPNTSYSHQY